MSEILVIVPPEWTPQNRDEILGVSGFTIQYFQEASGRNMTDLNDRLASLGWFKDDLRIIDVLVINEEIFFKFGEV